MSEPMLAPSSYSSFLISVMPHLMRAASFTVADLMQLDRKFEAHFKNLSQEEYLETTLFDLASIFPEESSAELFRFAEEVGKCITSGRTPPGHRRLKEMIRRFVGTGDHSNGYLTGIGELAILCELLKMPFLEVTSIEQPLPNGKTADFQIQKNGELHHIEVVTVRFDSGRIDSDDDVVEFFKSRAAQKLAHKTKGLPKNFNLLLVLVLFGADDIERLLSFADGLYRLCRELEKTERSGRSSLDRSPAMTETRGTSKSIR